MLFLLSAVQSLNQVQLFVTPWTAAWTSLFITNSQSLLKLMSIELMMPSNHLILCFPLLLPPSIIPSIRVFSNESVLNIRWAKYWSFSFSISPSERLLLNDETRNSWPPEEMNSIRGQRRGWIAQSLCVIKFY